MKYRATTVLAILIAIASTAATAQARLTQAEARDATIAQVALYHQYAVQILPVRSQRRVSDTQIVERDVLVSRTSSYRALLRIVVTQGRRHVHVSWDTVGTWYDNEAFPLANENVILFGGTLR